MTEIVALDDLSTGDRRNLEQVAGVELVEGSILDPLTLCEAVADADALVHLAARPSVMRSVVDPVASHEANATGTVRVLEACRSLGVGHVVVASSSSVYGAAAARPSSEGGATRPLSPYAASKLATESYALAWSHCFGLPVLAFRFFNVFGPRQPAGHAYAAVIPAFVSAALAGRPLPVHGDGLHSRDFTFVDSITDVITRAVVDRVSSPDPVNLAFGSNHTLLEVIDLLSSILERDLEVEHQPERPGDVRSSQADQRALRTLFPGVEPVPLEEGLRRTVAWYAR